jgi:hypothetical protein
MVLASLFFFAGVMFLTFNSNATLTLPMTCFICSFLCIVSYAVFHFARCSRFLVGYDSAGHIHLHRRNNPVLDAQLVLEVRAGAIPHRCKLHGYNPHNWKVIASNEHFFFADSSGDFFSVRYCEKPHHAGTGYLSRDVRILSDTLRLIKQSASVQAIRFLALQQTQPSVEDSPIAGSIPANQG